MREHVARNSERDRVALGEAALLHLVEELGRRQAFRKGHHGVVEPRDIFGIKLPRERADVLLELLEIKNILFTSGERGISLREAFFISHILWDQSSGMLLSLHCVDVVLKLKDYMH